MSTTAVKHAAGVGSCRPTIIPPMPGLPIVVADGPPRNRGRRIGAELGDLIHAQLSFHRARLGEQRLTGTGLRRQLQPFLDAAQTGLPQHVEQLHGMAEGAHADFLELFAMNALEELEPQLEGAGGERCSTVTVTTTGGTFLAHNEQWYAGDAGLTAIVIERPQGEVAIASPTTACYLPAVGMNAAGAAFGIDSLVATDDGVGIPRVLVSRHALPARDRAEAIRRAGIPGRAGGYAHVCAFSGGDAPMIETTAHQLAVVDGPGAHTNHYLAPELADLGTAPSEGSLGRHERLRELLAAARPQCVEDLFDVMRDHAARPDAICLHADGRDGTWAECVVFSMVCHVEARRMWVAPGNPCATPYEEVDLTDVFESHAIR